MCVCVYFCRHFLTMQFVERCQHFLLIVVLKAAFGLDCSKNLRYFHDCLCISQLIVFVDVCIAESPYIYRLSTCIY